MKMKNIFKKIFVVVIAMIMTISLSTILVYAQPDDGTGEVSQDSSQESTSLIPTPIVAESVETQAPQGLEETGNSGNERGDIMSVNGVILIGILIVIINAVISFVIANRFYKLTKKDSHIQSEIRALRRDIDDKFAGNITSIKEKSIKIKNSNPNYSFGEEIKVQKSVPPKDTGDKEIAEFAKRWNIEVESEKDPEMKLRKSSHNSRNYTSYQPERQTTTTLKNVKNVTDPVDDDKSSVKSKAKKFMGEIFPFDDEK